MDEEKMIQFNEEAFDGFNKNALIPCKHCNRTFLPDSLKIHRKICTAERPFKPLKRNNQKAKPKPVARGGHDWEDRPIGGGRKKQMQYDSVSEEEYAPPPPAPKKKPAPKRKPNLYQKRQVKKQRNFYEDSDDDTIISNNYSYSRPKKGQHLGKKEEKKPSFRTNQMGYNSKPKPSKYNTGQNGVNRRPNPKKKKPAFRMDSESEEEDYMARQPKKPARQAPRGRAKPKPKPKPRAQPQVSYDFSGPPANLEQCRICGRSFAEDRIKKHQAICKIQSRKKTKVKRFHKIMTKREKNKIERGKPEKKWKQQHKEFVKQMRYMRKLKQVEEAGGDIRMVAPPPPSSQPGLVPCKYCGRKFREEAHARHEGICQRVFGGKKGPSKPKRTKQQRRRGY